MNVGDNANPVETYLTYDSEAEKLAPEARLLRMSMYAEWLAGPADAREPSTKKDVAERLGISYETLKDYEKDPRFQRMYNDLVNATLKVANLGDIIHSLVVQATDPFNTRSVQAARLLLDWIDTHSADESDQSLRDASMEDIRNELELRA